MLERNANRPKMNDSTKHVTIETMSIIDIAGMNKITKSTKNTSSLTGYVTLNVGMLIIEKIKISQIWNRYMRNLHDKRVQGGANNAQKHRRN